MTYKEEIKIKPIISFILCQIMFYVLLNESSSLIFMCFSIYFLLVSINRKTVEIDDSSIKLYSGIRKSKIDFIEIERIEIVKERTNVSNLVYLGILYFLLDFSIRSVMIFTKDKVYKIPMKYFNDDFLKEIQELILSQKFHRTN